MRITRRAILLGAAALVAGAVVNVGVAWGIGATLRDSTAPYFSTPNPGQWPMTVPIDWPQPQGRTSWSPALGAEVAVVYASETITQPTQWLCVSARIGLPWKALWAGWRERKDPSGAATDHPSEWWRGIDASRSKYKKSWGCGLRFPFLPLIPLWPGFALNTLVYAAVVSAPFWLVGAIRRWRRRANWQCDRCGYDRRGLARSAACPECGHPSPPSGAPAR